MKYARMLILFLLVFVLAVPAYSIPELYKVSISGVGASAYVNYTLNCTADMTFEIFPCDSSGNITGAKVRTQTQSNVTRGSHTYLWPCTKDDGSAADPGYYLCRLTASANPTSFSPLFTSKADNPGLMYDSFIPIPMADIWGYYGASINTNPDSPYYGRIYAGNANDKQVYMWDCDGTFLGALDDSGIGWGGSAPWDLYVARDGYVYVSDRSAQMVYCFPPDGSHWVSSGSGTYSNGMFVRQTADDITHIYISSGFKIYHCAVSADYLTWTLPQEVADPPDSVSGLWVSPDRSYMYVCQNNGDVRKWNKGSGETFTQDAVWSCPVTNALDVCATPDEDYLFIGRFVAASSGPIAKYPISGGSPIYYNGTPYVKGVQTDSVGNVLITYGKNSSTWPSYYWCLATEPGTFAATRTTTPVYCQPEMPPIVVPGSETWTYSDPSGQLIPDGTSTATVCFKVMDVNGCSDICSVKVDLRSVKLASDPSFIQDIDSMVCQPDGITAVCCKTFTAVRGSKAGLHTLRVEPRDCHYPAVPPNPTDLDFYVQGATFNGTVKHIRHNALIAGATISVIGGMSGVYGYPFTYTGLTDSNGQASVSISEGSFTAIASKIGYKTQTPISLAVVPPDIGGSIAMEFYLGPVTIAEAKALPSGTTASVEGVCFAWPKGLAPTAACGLDYRLYSVSGTTGDMYNQWYMCDRDDAANGMLFQLKPTADPIFPFTWDDPSKFDDFGVSMYIGSRPALGNTICLTGEVNLIPGYEKRCRVKDEDFAAESGYDPQTYNQTYMNRGNLGGLPSPIPITIPQVYHDWNVVVAPASWGSFVSLANARVVKYAPGMGAIPEGAYAPAPGEEHIPTAIVMDNSFNWTTITFQTPSSLCIADPPVHPGCVYTFTGAAGRRARNGVGTIRVRQASDIVTTCDPFPTDDNIGTVRGAPALGKELVGIVTGKWPTYVYVESSDRSSGVRVNASAAAQMFITVGDKVYFTGSTALVDGQKQVTLTSPFVILSSNNPLPYSVMRTMDVGGADYGPFDPGITYGRGPLNVGLLVRLFGRVTARDPGGQWFYMWDGASMYMPGVGSIPLDDGTGNNGVRVISSFAVVPGTDFVKVTGVVSTNTTTVPGRVIPEILPTETPFKIAP